MLKVLIFLIHLILFCDCATIKSNDTLRDTILRAENILTIGGNIFLNAKELKVDEVLIKIKQDEILKGIEDSNGYMPGMHYFRARPLIEKSRTFKFIKRMPKGSTLHLHSTAAVSSKWIIKNLTYRADVKMCKNSAGVYLFKTLESANCITKLENLSQMRERNDPIKFDEFLERQINLYTPLPEISYPSINTVWERFESMFDTISGLLTYEPIFRAYYHQLLLEHYLDGVLYIELRGSFPGISSSDGVAYTASETMKILMQVIEDFKKEYPDFVGCKGIFAVSRRVDAKKLTEKVEYFKKFQAEFPEFIIGLDLVGQEELGNSLQYHMPILSSLPPTTKFFFHAGETNFFGTPGDLNMVDAILLNTTRIGHGYSLIKHPVLLDIVKEKGIAIEISPISNQVLKLTSDLRNHPGMNYNSRNIPIVIVNDDPGFFNTKGLSYDFYYAFMAFTSANSGLRSLKQFVWNSIKYSILTPEEIIKMNEVIHRRWDTFLDDVIAGQVI